MSTRARSRAAPVARLGGEQVEGRQAVRALLEARRRRVHEVVLATTPSPSSALDDIVRLAAATGVPVRRVRPEALSAAARSEVPQGVIALACGTYGNVIRLLPPLVISDEQLADGLSVLAAAVRAAS